VSPWESRAIRRELSSGAADSLRSKQVLVHLVAFSPLNSARQVTAVHTGPPASLCPMQMNVLGLFLAAFVGACSDTGTSVGVAATARAATAIKVSFDSPTITVGQSTRATATLVDSSGSTITPPSDLRWSSTDATIASVSTTGVVTALKVGTVMIAASALGKSANAVLNVDARTPVSSVVVALGSPSVTVDQTTQATVTAKDASGATLVGQSVTFASLSPSVATVSSAGVVTGVAAGTASITATVGGVIGTTTVTVAAPGAGVLASVDFNDGSFGSLVYPWTDPIDDIFPRFRVVDDPTGSGRGKVARITYRGNSGSTTDRALEYFTPTRLRYGKTLWFRGDLYIPSTTITGTTVAGKDDDNRKLLDYQGGGVRMTLHRRYGSGQLFMSIVDWMNGSEQEVMDPKTGIVLPADRWVTIEVRMVTNSADGVRDGVIEIYINGASTPSFRQATGLGWITERYAGGSYFSALLIGSQLTVTTPTGYTEYRYWDNISFSTTRLR
jgi:hypothetical protein